MFLGWGWFHVMRTLAPGRCKMISKILVVKRPFFRNKHHRIFELKENWLIPTVRVPGKSPNQPLCFIMMQTAYVWPLDTTRLLQSCGYLRVLWYQDILTDIKVTYFMNTSWGSRSRREEYADNHYQQYLKIPRSSRQIILQQNNSSPSESRGIIPP